MRKEERRRGCRLRKRTKEYQEKEREGWIDKGSEGISGEREQKDR